MKVFILLMYIFTTTYAFGSVTKNTNDSIQSFNKAKKLLEKHVYNDHKKTIYCDAQFEKDKSVIFPQGFVANKYKKRAKKIEWEHIVPAENFGRTFSEWREGHPQCINSKNKI